MSTALEKYPGLGNHAYTSSSVGSNTSGFRRHLHMLAYKLTQARYMHMNNIFKL